MAGLAVALLAAPALAQDAPRVATDIAPVESLVARVMEGAGTPELVIPPGASPHAHAMRPSEARALAAADLVVSTGAGLAPWFAEAVATLAPEARVLDLSEVDGVLRLAVRVGGTFEAHDHDHGHGHGAGTERASKAGHDDDHGHEDAHADTPDEHGHDDHADHGHDDHGRDDNGEEASASGAVHEASHGHGADASHPHDDETHAAGHDHATGAEKPEGQGRPAKHAEVSDAELDSHLWLDPVNAKVWVAAIAEALAGLDPERAALYRANAAAAEAELVVLIAEVEATVAPVRGTPFIVFHDAYRYFEERFDIRAAGSVSAGDSAAPGAARVAEIRETVTRLEAACVFTEPQFPPRLAETVREGTPARLAPLDPIGAALERGPGLYPALIRGMANSLAGCLGKG